MRIVLGLMGNERVSKVETERNCSENRIIIIFWIKYFNYAMYCVV